MTTEASDPAAIRLAAMNLLARREHSRRELLQKLQRRFSETDILPVIERLMAENLQSDDRFAEAFTTSRQRQGQGPVRIAMELRERGIDETLIGTYIDPQDENWMVCAREVWQKRFGERAGDRTARAKQMRFLQYRGFTMDQINRVIANPDME